jgi:hypothetical protein
MATQVVLLVDGYKKTEGLDITTGTKRFIEAEANPDATPEDLPSIGSKWDDDNEYLLAKQIEESYAGNSECYKVWEVTYDSRPIDNSEFNVIANINDEFPQGVEIAAEIRTYDMDAKTADSDNCWRKAPANGNTLTANEIIASMQRTKVEVLMSFTITRYIEPDDAASFIMDTCRPLLGKVNNKDFYGIPRGCALYCGTTIEQSGKRNKLMYKTISKFSIKFVPLVNSTFDGHDYAGWNFYYDKDTNDYVPIIFGKKNDTYVMNSLVKGRLMYDEVDFDPITSDSRAAITL